MNPQTTGTTTSPDEKHTYNDIPIPDQASPAYPGQQHVAAEPNPMMNPAHAANPNPAPMAAAAPPMTGAHPGYYGQAVPVANVYPLHALQTTSLPVDCPLCAQREMTSVKFKTGGTTHAIAALLCCVACVGCIPYLASWFKDAQHYCGRCGQLLAVHHRGGTGTEVIAGRAQPQMQK